jgi:hypothetical protein
MREEPELAQRIVHFSIGPRRAGSGGQKDGDGVLDPVDQLRRERCPEAGLRQAIGDTTAPLRVEPEATVNGVSVQPPLYRPAFPT